MVSASIGIFDQSSTIVSGDPISLHLTGPEVPATLVRLAIQISIVEVRDMIYVVPVAIDVLLMLGKILNPGNAIIATSPEFGGCDLRFPSLDRWAGWDEVSNFKRSATTRSAIPPKNSLASGRC